MKIIEKEREKMGKRKKILVVAAGYKNEDRKGGYLLN